MKNIKLFKTFILMFIISIIFNPIIQVNAVIFQGAGTNNNIFISKYETHDIANNFEYTIEGYGYILYSNFFKPDDVSSQAWNGINISKKVDIDEYNNLVNIIEDNKNEKILIEISDDENIEKINEVSNIIEIVELNNVKYVVANVRYIDGNYCFAKGKIDENVLNTGLNFKNNYFNNKEFSIDINVSLNLKGIDSIDWITDIYASQKRNYTTYIYNEENDTTEELVVDYSSHISLNIFKENYESTLTLNKFKEVQKYLKDNNMDTLIQKVKVYIPNNVLFVKDTSNNKQYTVYEDNGNKYIIYDIEIMKSNLNDIYDIMEYYENTIFKINNNTYLEFQTDNNEIKTCFISGALNDPISLYSDVSEYGSYIGDENGNWQLDKFKVQDEYYGECYAVSSYYHALRQGGWVENNYPTQTNISYLNEYLYFEVPYNIGEKLILHVSGIKEKDISLDFWKKHEWSDNHYIYRTKITQDIEDLLFSKPQNIELSYKAYNDNLKLPHTIKTYLSVEGKNRTKLTINNDDVKIDFNGVLPINVSIKSDKIEDNTEVYATLTTTGINSLKSKYNIYTPLINLTLKNIYTVGGNIDGDIQLTFNVGQEYNDKYVYITHLKQNNEWEHFKEKVEDGKVYIVVNELSPFMLSINDDLNVIKGDLDDNGIVNANDAAIALDLYKYGNVTPEQLKAADMDNNGIINANDAALILDIYKYGN